MNYPRSPKDQTSGIVYFGRMVDKIRLMQAGNLHPDLHANLGKGFDGRVLSFFGVDYESLRERVLQGGTDEEILEWCWERGNRPTGEQIEVWNDFMIKRGWKDVLADTLARRKKESGFEERGDIETMFQYIDADEGRL
jgi:gluconokinase